MFDDKKVCTQKNLEIVAVVERIIKVNFVFLYIERFNIIRTTMLKKIYIYALLILPCITNVYAQESEGGREKVVSNKWSFVSGSGSIASHYLSNQEFQGNLIGVMGEHGAFYKKSENLSWDLGLSMLFTPSIKEETNMLFTNPAKNCFLKTYSFSAKYGTHYNWKPTSDLFLKAGGTFEFLFASNSTSPNSINNVISLDLQTQLMASAGIRYGRDFKKIGLYAYADIAIPFGGFMLVDSRYQSSLSSIGSSNILNSSIRHFKFSSFHNLQGYNLEMGCDFVLKNMTLSISNEKYNRWWHAYELQNYRKFDLVKLSLSVDLVSRTRKNSNNRYF